MKAYTNSNCIITLVNNSRFTHEQTKETLKFMFLQHAIKYHKVRDWIRQQNQQELIYASLLTHCKLLKSYCEQYQGAREKGCTQLTTITAASAMASSIHQDALHR